MTDIIEQMKTALRIFLGGDDRFRIVVMGNPVAVDKMLAAARAVLADAERLGEPVLYPAVPATDEWPGRGAYLVIPVLDKLKESV